MDSVLDAKRGFVNKDKDSMMGKGGSDDEDQVNKDNELMGQNTDNIIKDANAMAPENPQAKTPTLPAQQDNMLIAVGITELAKELGLA
ncbi:hypothetical protein V5O48_016385 [Marasmius crinis-equi]|uniref:Uncharacterized protein n=1 Tax=Marasmius crinis-equi TaxID=585013 RepID=A0ABR3ERX1_9AGAR